MLDNPLSPIATKTLDALFLNQNLMARNVAQANVEGFQPSRVDFERYVNDLKHSSAPLPLSTYVNVEAGKVSLDKEMALMSENLLRYQAVIDVMNKQKAVLKLAITGRSS